MIILACLPACLPACLGFVMLLSEYLEDQKKKETTDGILQLMRSRYLQDFCSAWAASAIAFNGGKTYKKPAMWRCWDQCSYDLEQISQLSAVPYSRAHQLFEQVKGLGLIYPDGTLNKNVQRVLNQLAQQELKRLVE